MKECVRCERMLSSSDASLLLVEGEVCMTCFSENKNENLEYKMADEKKKVERKKMTEEQKKALKEHMDSLELDAKGKKSHRLKMMARMLKGKSVEEAHKEIVG